MLFDQTLDNFMSKKVNCNKLYFEMKVPGEANNEVEIAQWLVSDGIC